MTCCHRLDLLIPSRDLYDPQLRPLRDLVISEEPGSSPPAFTVRIEGQLEPGREPEPAPFAIMRVQGPEPDLGRVLSESFVGLAVAPIDPENFVFVDEVAEDLARERLGSVDERASLAAQLEAAGQDPEEVRRAVFTQVLTRLSRLASDGRLRPDAITGIDLDGAIHHALHMSIDLEPSPDPRGLVSDVRIEGGEQRPAWVWRLLLDPTVDKGQPWSKMLHTKKIDKVEVRVSQGSVTAEGAVTISRTETTRVIVKDPLEVVGLENGSVFSVAVNGRVRYK